MRQAGARLIALLVLAIAGVGPAVARAQTLTVVNAAGLPASALERVERAVRQQANGQLRPIWHTSAIRFGAGGWPVIVGMDGSALCGAALGCHAFIDGRPVAYVDVSLQDWSISFSHEVLEALVDPRANRYIRGALVEVCDPLEAAQYRLDGVWVSDFVTRTWYSAVKRGRRLDWLGQLRPSGLVVS